MQRHRSAYAEQSLYRRTKGYAGLARGRRFAKLTGGYLGTIWHLENNSIITAYILHCLAGDLLQWAIDD